MSSDKPSLNLSFHVATRDDYPAIVGWLAKPHVRRWWREPEPTLEAVERHYGDRIDGNDPTSLYIVVEDSIDIGIVQSYWIDDYPDHAATLGLTRAVGIDLFIGELGYTGRGVGPVLLTNFINSIVRPKYIGAQYVVADPEVANAASVRAFLKAGFMKEKIISGDNGPEQIMVYRL